MKILIGRHPENITLNPMEYVLDELEEPMIFNSIKEAKEFLISRGINKKLLNQFHYITLNKMRKDTSLKS